MLPTKQPVSHSQDTLQSGRKERILNKDKTSSDVNFLF
jgi:hypothetical protein